MAEFKSDPSELNISDPEPGASQVSYPLKLAMGTVAGGRVTYYHSAYLQLRLSANDPVIHFLKQAEITLSAEREY
jgi:hypothetical protein